MTKSYRLIIDFTSDDYVMMQGGPLVTPEFVAMAIKDVNLAGVTSFRLEKIENGEEVTMPDCQIVDRWSVEDQAELMSADQTACTCRQFVEAVCPKCSEQSGHHCSYSKGE